MSEKTEATIFDIQRFSLHDGPGIRTLVFLKGCSLACKWCSNPEGISFEPEIRNNRRLCVGCMRCIQGCPAGAVNKTADGIHIDRNICLRCGNCISSCKAHALSWWGKRYTVEELFKQVQRDRPFFESSGGGVTLGGGDPLLQNRAAVELLKICKENGINTAIETAGNYPWAYLENAAPYCDTIHFDLKGWRDKICIDCFATDNKLIKENIQKLDDWIGQAEKKPVFIIRIPLIPDFNFSLQDFSEAAVFLAKLSNVTKIEILPFHNLGQSKYDQLDREYYFRDSENLKEDEVENYLIAFQQAKLPVVVSTI